jgi:hypothetical protein
VTRTGTVTFSGGTGKFQHFTASLVITFLSPRNWALDGTYSFSAEGDREDRDYDQDRWLTFVVKRTAGRRGSVARRQHPLHSIQETLQ